MRSRFFLILLAVSIAAYLVPSQATAQSSIQWYSMEDAQQLASENGKKVLIFAEATWCVYCKKMDQEVFTQKAVIDSMNVYFYPVRVDIESNSPMKYNNRTVTGREFARNNQVQATPTFFFMDKNGKKLGAQPGFIPAQTFSRLLGFVGSDAFKKMGFRKYLKQHAPDELKGNN